MRTLLVVGSLFFGVAVACGASSETNGGDATPTNPAPGPTTSSSSTAGSSGNLPPPDASTADAKSSTDAGDSGSAVPPATPPAGATICAQGKLSAADILAACNQPATFGPTPVSACADMTSDGGSYQIWCTADLVYIWAEVDNLRPTKTGCPAGGPNFALDSPAHYAYSGAAGVGAGGASLASDGTAPYVLAPQRSFSLSATVGGPANGQATIWASGVDVTACTDTAPYGAVVAAVSVSWPSTP